MTPWTVMLAGIGTAVIAAACSHKSGGSATTTPTPAPRTVTLSGVVTASTNGGLSVPLGGATVEVVGATPANQATTAGDGSYTLTVSDGQMVLLRFGAASYQSQQTAVFGAPGEADVDTSLWPRAYLASVGSALGMTFDPAEGMVSVHFGVIHVAGEGAQLSAASGSSFIFTQSGPVFAVATSSAADNVIYFPNVATGTTTVNPDGNGACVLSGLTNWPVDAGVLTTVQATCE